jgi:hypothetical protein
MTSPYRPTTTRAQNLHRSLFLTIRRYSNPPYRKQPFTITINKATNMFFALVALALAATTPLAAAVGNATVINNCSYCVSAWSVGSSVSGPYELNPSGGSYTEQFVKDPQTGGIAIKITVQPDGLYTGQPQTIFAYNLDGDQVWYDLSDVFGDAFSGQKVVESSAGAGCPAIVWDNGLPPAGSQVKVCSSDDDVTLTLCA